MHNTSRSSFKRRGLPPRKLEWARGTKSSQQPESEQEFRSAVRALCDA